MKQKVHNVLYCKYCTSSSWNEKDRTEVYGTLANNHFVIGFNDECSFYIIAGNGELTTAVINNN